MAWLWAVLLLLPALGCNGYASSGVNGDAMIPAPSARQLHWQRKELLMFLHFGVNTYTGREWGLGNENPNIFQPVDLNTTQWVETAKQAGFKEMILVVKHHDGFFLFPNQYTNHTVQFSSWRDYKGDVASDFIKSCKALDMDPAFYLSPWDRNYYNMTWKPSYNAFYEKTEEWLVTHYGPFYELWWDGANAVANRSGLYEWSTWLDILRKNQPDAVGGGCGGWAGSYDCGPDTAWIKNENGIAPETVWSWHAASVEFPSPDNVPVYAPYFCDVSIRPGWFWHENQNDKLKSLSELVDIYFQSVGRNCNLQLNVPPNQKGLLQDGDVKRVLEFGDYLSKMYAKDYAAGADVAASSAVDDHPAKNILDADLDSFWQASADDKKMTVTLQFSQDAAADMFNVIMVQEYLPGGQRISGHTVSMSTDGHTWTSLVTATTVGQKRLHLLSSPMAVPKFVQFQVTSTAMNSTSPALSRFSLLMAEPITE